MSEQDKIYDYDNNLLNESKKNDSDNSFVLDKKKTGESSPCRDISWHPYMPVIATTEFNGMLNLWTV